MNTYHVVYVNPGRFVLPYAAALQRMGFDNHYFIPIGNTSCVDEFCTTVHNSIRLDYPTKKSPIQFLRFFRSFVRVLNKADIIIWHSLFFKHLMLYMLDGFHKKIIKKSYWLIWGGDLYGWKKRGFPGRIDNSFYKRFVNHLRGAIVLFEPDADEVRSSFEFTGDIYHANYYAGGSKIMDGVMSALPEEHGGKWILIGHSAVSQMNHKTCLDILTPLQDKNIRIILPLSYGDMDYAKEVVSYARQKFGAEKIVHINSYMETKEYFRMLRNVDAAVFYTDRQMALGNIYPLMYMNKPVYMKKGSVMYTYFKNIGCTIYDAEDLPKIDCEQLERPTDCKNHDTVKSLYNDRSFAEKWMAVFNGMNDSIKDRNKR